MATETAYEARTRRNVTCARGKRRRAGSSARPRRRTWSGHSAGRCPPPQPRAGTSLIFLSRSLIQSLTGIPSRSRTRIRAATPTTHTAMRVRRATSASFVGQSGPASFASAENIRASSATHESAAGRSHHCGHCRPRDAAPGPLRRGSNSFPRGLIVLGCVVVALSAGCTACCGAGPCGWPPSRCHSRP